MQLASLENLDGDARTALGATRVDDTAAADSFHANPETMCLLAAGYGGLVCAFHNCSRIVSAGGKSPVEELAGSTSRTWHYRVFLCYPSRRYARRVVRVPWLARRFVEYFAAPGICLIGAE